MGRGKVQFPFPVFTTHACFPNPSSISCPQFEGNQTAPALPATSMASAMSSSIQRALPGMEAFPSCSAVSPSFLSYNLSCSIASVLPQKRQSSGLPGTLPSLSPPALAACPDLELLVPAPPHRLSLFPDGLWPPALISSSPWLFAEEESIKGLTGRAEGE